MAVLDLYATIVSAPQVTLVTAASETFTNR